MSSTASVYIATSLDGFIAREDGNLDWLHFDSGGEDYGFHAFMSTVDTLLMGRKTYETVLAFGEWPYDKPVVVWSRTLRGGDVPAHLAGKVAITSGDPKSVLDRLAASGVRHVYVDGGQTIQAFLRAGLIQELTISHIPVLIGAGIPLFGALDSDIRLIHMETKAFASGLVQSRYRVAPTG